MDVKPALPYPIGIKIDVYRDDGKWDEMRWWERASHVLKSLAVCRITLAHYDGEDEPCYTVDEWGVKADELVQKHPGCVFVYVSNEPV